MRKTLFGLWYLPVFTVLTVLAACVCLVASIFSKDLARRLTSQTWASIVLAPARIKVLVPGGTDSLPARGSGGFIIYANHRSLLDIPVVARATRLSISWVAKAALGRIPFFGWGLKRVHMLVDRGGSVEAARQMLGEASRRLQNGEIMAIFPEGTRNKTPEPILPFKKGAFILAKHTGVPLVPVAILHSGELWPSGSLVPKSGTVKVAVGEPISPKAGDSLSKLAQNAEAALRNLYLDLEKEEA
jgi:1-acyl-sn-glycerol-3-phosphate acyltransferase